MVVIYDVNGFIAGMQSIVFKKFIQGPYDFAGSNWYRSDNILGKAIESRITIQQSNIIIQQSNFNLGEDAYLTTAYFVDPSRICNGGRDQAAFDVEGSGNRLWFQNGPTIKDMHVAPLTVDAADANVS